MRYERPTTMKQASVLLTKEKGSAYVLAGGTDLLVRLRTGFIEPDLVVDIKRIAGMREIASAAGGFRIGAAVCGRGARRACQAEKGLAGRGRGRQPHRLQAGSGPRTMAGNLCNASPAADSVPALVAAGAKAVIVGPKGKRTIPGRAGAGGAGQDLAQEGRDRRERSFCPSARRARAMPICASSRAPRWISPSSAPASA